MRRMHYMVFDTSQRKYLELAVQPLGTDGELVTKWTRHPEKALKFPGIKSGQRMVRKLGGYSEIVVKNERGEVVG